MSNETKKTAARQWVAVCASYDDVSESGEKKRQTAEFVVESGTFGYAEKSVRMLLSGHTGVNVTSCRRKYVNRLVFAAGAHDEETAVGAAPWDTYEAQVEATDEKGKKKRRAYLAVAPSFTEAYNRLLLAVDPRCESVMSLAVKPRMVVVTATDEKDL